MSDTIRDLVYERDIIRPMSHAPRPDWVAQARMIAEEDAEITPRREHIIALWKQIRLRDEAIAATAIVPGDVQASELVIRIFSDDADLQMPPPDARTKLTQQQRQYGSSWLECPLPPPVTSTGGDGGELYDIHAYLLHDQSRKPERPPGRRGGRGGGGGGAV